MGRARFKHRCWRLRDGQVRQRGPNVFSTAPSKFGRTFYSQVQGRWGEGEDRGGEGDRQEGEELGGFDAMQTGSTEARRQKFSVYALTRRQERWCANTGAIRLQRRTVDNRTLKSTVDYIWDNLPVALISGRLNHLCVPGVHGRLVSPVWCNLSPAGHKIRFCTFHHFKWEM